jgi:hypothetical protein
MPGAWSALRPELEGTLTPRGIVTSVGSNAPAERRTSPGSRARATMGTNPRRQPSAERQHAWRQAERSLHNEVHGPPAVMPVLHNELQQRSLQEQRDAIFRADYRQKRALAHERAHAAAPGTWCSAPSAQPLRLGGQRREPLPYEERPPMPDAFEEPPPPMPSALPIARSAVRASGGGGTSARAEAARGPKVALSGGHSHPASLVSLWRSASFTDVDVLVEGQSFPAHRLVLAASSPHLAQLLSAVPVYPAAVSQRLRASGAPPPPPHRAAVINLDRLVSADAFECILEWLYTGEVLAPALLLPALLEAAVAIELTKLQETVMHPPSRAPSPCMHVLTTAPLPPHRWCRPSRAPSARRRASQCGTLPIVMGLHSSRTLRARSPSASWMCSSPRKVSASECISECISECL